MSSDQQILENTIGSAGTSLPPLNGIARKKRSDAGVLRKSSMDTFCDLFRKMSQSEQSTALEVLRQIQRVKAKRDEQQFTIEFACHVTVRAEELHEIFKGSPDVFDIEIRPRQGQLFEGGTRVPVSNSELLSRAVKEMTPEQQKLADDILAGTDRDFGCVACNTSEETDDIIPEVMVDEAGKEAPLASAVAMGEGTHQAKRKPRADKSTVN